MSVTLWAFKDASRLVRITGNDPSAEMGARQLATLNIPGGFSMLEMRSHFENAARTLVGQTGEESYLKMVLEDLPAESLAFLMTPIAPEPGGSE